MSAQRSLTRPRGSRDTLELVTMGAADGITIQDATGGLVYANLAAARLSGYGSVDDFMAADSRERLAHWEMLNEDGEPFPVDELPGRRVLGGVPEAETVLRVRRPSRRTRILVTREGHGDVRREGQRALRDQPVPRHHRPEGSRAIRATARRPRCPTSTTSRRRSPARRTSP